MKLTEEKVRQIVKEEISPLEKGIAKNADAIAEVRVTQEEMNGKLQIALEGINSLLEKAKSNENLEEEVQKNREGIDLSTSALKNHIQDKSIHLTPKQ